MKTLNSIRRVIIKSKHSNLIIAVILSVLSLFGFYINFRYIATADTVPNEMLPISIIYEHNLDFNEFVDTGQGLPYYFKEIKGNIVSNYPIIPGILNVPVYFVAYLLKINLFEKRFSLSKITSSIISALSVFFIFLCLTRVCKKRQNAIFLTLVYAFATEVWSVASQGIWQHGPSLLFINIVLFILFTKKEKLIPYSGFFLGMAVFNRPTNFLIAFPLTIYILFNYKKQIIKYFFWAAIPALFLILYSYAYLGSITNLGQGQGFQGFSGNFFEGFLGILISPARGLLIFSPIFIFSFIYIPKIFIQKKEVIYKYLAVSLLLLLICYSKWGMWWGGWSFGYRLLIETLPILIIFLALCWEDIISKNVYLMNLFIILLFISVYIHFLGAYWYPSGFNWIPQDIDASTKRLWDIRNTELIQDNNNLLKYLRIIN